MRRARVLMMAAVWVLTSCGRSADLSEAALQGETLVNDLGCVTCHGQADGIGPSWSGRWGTLRDLADGTTVVFDSDYVRSSVLDPENQVVKGFDPVMPAFSVSDAELASIAAYLEELE